MLIITMGTVSSKCCIHAGLCMPHQKGKKKTLNEIHFAISVSFTYLFDSRDFRHDCGDQFSGRLKER